MKKSVLFILCCVCNFLSVPAQESLKINKNSTSPANGLIHIYFNNPVDTTVATGEKAIYLHNTIDDTLVAYINRAKYTIDIAVYNFLQSSSIADIASAINNAYLNGIRIR